MLRPTVCRPVSLGVKHPSGAYDQITNTCVRVTVFFFWGALSDVRSCLSFVCAACPCQRSLSRVRVPWDLRPSHLRLQFRSLLRFSGSRWRNSTPPPHGCELYLSAESVSESYVTTDVQPASLRWSKAPILGLRQNRYYMCDSYGFFLVGRPL
jgi:hypothetical protein